MGGYLVAGHGTQEGGARLLALQPQGHEKEGLGSAHPSG